MTFKDQPFDKRVQPGGMGDRAESVFEAVYPQAWDRMGWNRPRTPMQGMAPMLRFMPDYMTYKGPVEVQGFGSDQTIKLKCDKYDALMQWDHIQDTRLFLWDSHNRRHAILPMAGPDSIRQIVNNSAIIDTFPEGKDFFAMNADLVTDCVAWTKYDPDA